MEKKYEIHNKFLLLKTGEKVYPITALKDIPMFDVKIGDFGGYIEHEYNLCHSGNAWIGADCIVTGTSIIKDDVLIEGRVLVINSELSQDIRLFGDVMLSHCYITGTKIRIKDRVRMTDVNINGTDILIKDDCVITNVFGRGSLDNFRMSGKAKIENEIEMNLCGSRIAILDEALIKNVRNLIGKDIFIQDHAILEEQSSINGNTVTIKDFAFVTNGVNIEDNVTVAECVKLFADSFHMDGIQNAIFTGDRKIDVRHL